MNGFARLTLRMTAFALAAGMMLAALACLAGTGVPSRQLLFTVMRYQPPTEGNLFLADIGRGLRHNLTPEPGMVIRPQWSPDGTRIAYVRSGDGQSSIEVLDVAGGTRTRLVSHAPDDLVPLWTPDGARVIYRMNRESAYYIVDATGGERQPFPLFTETRGRSFVWSPDGRQVAYKVDEGTPTVYVMDADGGRRARLGDHSSFYPPQWSPDSQRVLYHARTPLQARLYVVNADGSEHRPLMDDGRSGYSAAWSPDGGRVAFAALGLHIVGADGVGVRELSLNDRLSRLCCVTNLTWSPDGETIAFTAGPDDFREVYVIAPDGGGLTQWSDYRADGAALSVAWRPVGRGEG